MRTPRLDRELAFDLQHAVSQFKLETSGRLRQSLVLKKGPMPKADRLQLGPKQGEEERDEMLVG